MGGSAKYIIMIPRVPHDPQLAHRAHHALVSGKIALHHAFLDEDKYAHWPGKDPELHDLLTAYGDDTPEMDSHVKQLAHSVAKHGMLPAVFALKEGGKQGIVRWTIDNPEAHNALLMDPSAGGPGVGEHGADRARSVGAAHVVAGSFRITSMGDIPVSAHESSPAPYRKRPDPRNYQPGMYTVFMGLHPRKVGDFMLRHFPEQPCQIERGQGTYVPEHGGEPYMEDSTTLHLFAMPPGRWPEFMKTLGHHFPEQESFGYISPTTRGSDLFMNPHHVPGGDRGTMTDWDTWDAPPP